MKNILLFLSFIIPFVIYKYYFHQPHSEPEPELETSNAGLEKIKICKERAQSKSSSLNYIGPSLISNYSDPVDLVLCPGDAFGDLNDTYITVKNCYLAMYHQDKMIWSSKVHPQYRYLQLYEDKCAFSVKKDGNLALYLQGDLVVNPEEKERLIVTYQIWDSQTELSPAQTKVKFHNQKVQIIQTFEDGTQRLFYADGNHQEFIEDLGTPRKIADKFIVKNHSDEDKTILRRNEYIGDLNGTHLILQANCDIQLLNKDKIIWSFTPPFNHERSCVLSIQDRDHIAISKISPHQEDFQEDWQSIITKPKGGRDYQVIQSHITFEEDQPIIIRNLNNGSEITFSSGPGKDSALKPKKEPRQIAENTLALSRHRIKEFSMERMDYIGNLTGLHLILEQNCSLILANEKEKLWEFYDGPPRLGLPVMDCSILIDCSGSISFEKDYLGVYRQTSDILKKVDINQRHFITGLELKLENNQLIITRERSDRGPEIYHAGLNTRGILLQFISENSFIINPDTLALPKMSYIGNINGIYLVFEDKCKWILYNKMEVLWESGKNLSEENGCMMVMKKNGQILLTDKVFDENWLIWYTMEIPPGGLKAYKRVIKTELLVNDGGLWMVHTFKDGNASQYKAVEGTNYFGLLSKKDDLFFNSDL